MAQSLLGGLPLSTVHPNEICRPSAPNTLLLKTLPAFPITFITRSLFLTKAHKAQAISLQPLA